MNKYINRKKQQQTTQKISMAKMAEPKKRNCINKENKCR